MRRLGGTLLMVTGFLACPCHLIITLPLLLSLVAGTALGSFLSHNTGFVYLGAGFYFVLALALLWCAQRLSLAIWLGQPKASFPWLNPSARRGRSDAVVRSET
jgi:hypothetical protein